MSFLDLKISESAIQSTGVQSQPDTLTGSAADNKKVFDALPTLIIRQFNLLLEALGGTGAASEVPIEPIDGMTAKNVQQALAEISKNLADYIAKIKGTGGAAEVGVSAISGMSVSNTQQALVELKRLIDNLVIGTLPPGSVTANMIEDGAIVQLGALLAVSAAAEYDPEGSYAVGDYCTYGGKLHKCGTAIPDGEAWTAEHWTVTTVAAELLGLINQLSAKIGAKNGLGKNTDIDNLFDAGFYYTNSTTAETIQNAPYDIAFLLHVIRSDTSTANRALQISFPLSPSNTSIKYRKYISSNWTKWLTIQTETTPNIRNMAMQSGFETNGDCIFFVLQDSAVFFAGGVSGTLPENQDTQIGTLPADVIPSKLSRRAMTTNTGAGYIEIRTDGTVWAHPFSAASQCWFDTSFLAGGGL